ncbi:PREDICTED: exocyst complex component EXO70B1-like [Ipomoea nil]|uniref:exocyst complex component EXO70B1-like n=1 Tax=Ipomoea nil TaxID=35883 RepID=UPI000900E817|nr:PREDICTED: exocyst complex component EXO70B1-like [Ipomoea nil]
MTKSNWQKCRRSFSMKARSTVGDIIPHSFSTGELYAMVKSGNAKGGGNGNAKGGGNGNGTGTDTDTGTGTSTGTGTGTGTGDGDSGYALPNGSGDENFDLLSLDVDRFAAILSSVADKSNPPEIPDVVGQFSDVIESKVAKYHPAGECRDRMEREDDVPRLVGGVKRLAKLRDRFAKFPDLTPSQHRISTVLHLAITFLEDELRYLLEDSRIQISFEEEDEEESNSKDDVEYPEDLMGRMKMIAGAMVSTGFETECCQVYSIARWNWFSEKMKALEFEKLNMEDVQRMPWDLLGVEITRWITIVRKCSKILLPAERKLGESVFSDHPSVSRTLFCNLARTVAIRLLDFAEAVAMTKRSTEKLFKFLDVFETAQELIPVVSESCTNDYQNEVKSEIEAALERLGEAAVNIFTDLESSIKNDVARIPVPGGAVHPLTRYVMNYLKYACEYKDTLEHIFQQHGKVGSLIHDGEFTNGGGAETESGDSSPHNNLTTTHPTTPFSIQVITIMDLLDANLEAKSKLYRDPALRSIFLMNNGRYILQKVKGSAEIHKVMGNNWCRRRSTVVRQFHKNYQRETWGKVLQILSHEGLQGNAKALKPVLKERFKSFSTIFDEIHRSQSTWVVSDEQLQSELRVSISAVIIPAYRSFLGRFRQYFDNTKHAEKYIKYQPDDIETLIEGLFDGNTASMARRRL